MKKHLHIFLLLAAFAPLTALANGTHSATASENFENVDVPTPRWSGVLPDGWNSIYQGTDTEYMPGVYSESIDNDPFSWPYPYDSELSQAVGDKYLYIGACNVLNSSVGSPNLVVLPYYNVSAISFVAWKEIIYTETVTLQLGYVTDSNDASTFVALKTPNLVNYKAANLTNATFSYSNLNVPTGARLAFKLTTTLDHSDLFNLALIDNITVTYGVPNTHIASTSSSTQMTWAEFAQNVNNGITYEGQTVYLDSDVTATTRAGYATNSDTKSFHGTFDGQGHTITFNFTADNTYAAPFACVKNATFLNLKTAGTITANTRRYASGIAGMVISGSQNCTFTNCESNVTITSTSTGSTDCRHGGFVANVVGGNVTFNGCAFTGKFSGTNAKGWGGFVGYFNHYVYFTDCIFSPTSISINNQNNSTFARPSGTQVITFTNCYYNQSLGGSQGKQRYTVTAESPVTMTMNGTATTYNVSHITAYEGNTGLLYNGTVIAGSGDNLSLNLGGGGFYLVDHGTITGKPNPRTLTMAAYNTVVTTPSSTVPPYSEDFPYPISYVTWTCFNNDYNSSDMIFQSRWSFGNQPGRYCFFISSNRNNNSLYVNYSYYQSPASMVYAAKTFYLEANTYNFSYDIQCLGDILFRQLGLDRPGDYMRVALVPASVTLVASDHAPEGFSYSSLPSGWIPLDNEQGIFTHNWWGRMSKTVTIAEAGEYMMVFAWINDDRNSTTTYTNMPGAFDDVSITPVDNPVDLQCTNVSYYTATLSWTQQNWPATAWQICLNGDESNLIDASSNPFKLTGLAEGTAYTAKVRANWGDDGVGSWSDEISFVTKGDYNRNIMGYGSGNGRWYLIASPLVGETAPTSRFYNGEYDLYRFNQSAILEWENWKQEGEHYHFNLTNGQGYLYASSTNRALWLTGTPYTSSGEIPLDYDASAPRFPGWNLIGNPFGKAATLDMPSYKMNAAGTALEPQVENSTVACMEGVFVQATGTGQSATFTPANSKGRGEGNAVPLLNISVNKVVEPVETPAATAAIDNAIIRFDGGPSLGKFSFGEGGKIYVKQDGKDYAIASVGGRDVSRNVSTEVPVNFEAKANGTYTLAFATEAVAFSYLHLIDNMTGADIDLLATPTYTFTAKTGDYASRFRLVFSNCEDAIGDNAFAYIDASGNIIITDGPSTGAGTYMLQMVDALGRVVVSRRGDVSGNVSTAGMTPGVYVLRLINGEDVRVQKLVVR